ncbi:hypothetical protein CPB85DRAFT_1437701 [Mucidula mucida]|nr:hypothetical protein CPB85DRAFT_1437701 [Mucidula mucida]
MGTSSSLFNKFLDDARKGLMVEGDDFFQVLKNIVSTVLEQFRTRDDDVVNWPNAFKKIATSTFVDTNKYASRILPHAIADRISAEMREGLDIPHIMKTEIQRFDDSLLKNFTKHFAEGEDFSHEKWDDTREIYAVIGYEAVKPLKIHV